MLDSAYISNLPGSSSSMICSTDIHSKAGLVSKSAKVAYFEAAQSTCMNGIANSSWLSADRGHHQDLSQALCFALVRVLLPLLSPHSGYRQTLPLFATPIPEQAGPPSAAHRSQVGALA